MADDDVELAQLAKRGEFDRIDLSMDRPIKVELIIDGIDPTANTYKLKIELIDDDTYNGLYWAPEQLASMLQEFKKGDRHVSHGLDHSHKTLEQLGHVYDMEMIKENGKTRVNVFSENFKETAVQKEVLILFKQGLLNYISGGWKGRIVFNEEKGRFEIINPVLLEVSSTSVPAKKDARVLEILNSLQAPFSLDEDSEENNMPDETQGKTPPPPGESGAEDTKRLTLLEAEVKTLKETTLEQAKRVEAAERTALIAKGVELGLAVEDFKEMSNAEIQSSLSIANKAIVVALRGIDPTTELGAGASSTGKDGTPEMAAELLKTYAPHLAHGEPTKDGE